MSDTPVWVDTIYWILVFIFIAIAIAYAIKCLFFESKSKKQEKRIEEHFRSEVVYHLYEVRRTLDRLDENLSNVAAEITCKNK